MCTAFTRTDTHAAGDTHAAMSERAVWRLMHHLAVPARIPVPDSTGAVYLRCRGCVPVRADRSANAAAAAHANSAMRRRAVRGTVRDCPALLSGWSVPQLCDPGRVPRRCLGHVSMHAEFGANPNAGTDVRHGR